MLNISGFNFKHFLTEVHAYKKAKYPFYYLNAKRKNSRKNDMKYKSFIDSKTKKSPTAYFVFTVQEFPFKL